MRYVLPFTIFFYVVDIIELMKMVFLMKRNTVNNCVSTVSVVGLTVFGMSCQVKLILFRERLYMNVLTRQLTQ